MEAKSSSSPFQVFPDQIAMNATTSLDMFASWLDSDSFNNSELFCELPNFQIPSDHLLQNPPTSDFFTNIPLTDEFLYDLWELEPEVCTEGTSYQPSVEPVAPVAKEEEVNGFIIDGPRTDVHMDGIESFVDHVTESALAPEEVVVEEEEVNDDDDPKGPLMNCKNLVSERNRRKRLSQQLLALRALVPNITKMDKRSILMDALDYLRSIHEEIAWLEKGPSENSQIRASRSEKSRENPQSLVPPIASSDRVNMISHILEIDTYKIDDRRFVVKMTGKGGASVGRELVGVIESLGFKITLTTLELTNPNHVSATAFVKVKESEKMTEKKLKERITNMALQSRHQI